jgi:hypothetical protein
MSEELTLEQRYDALRRLYEQAIDNIEWLRSQRVELEGQVIQNGAEAIRLRELLVQVVQEINLADLSPALRHAIEDLRNEEME